MPVAGLPGGDFDGCVREMTGKVDDAAGFCAWKIHELTGRWPSEENAPLPPTGERNVEHLEAKLSAGKTGREWSITIIGPASPDDLITSGGIEYIRSQNGRLYEVDGIRESTSEWDGVHVYDNHLTDKEFEERAGMRSFLGEGVGVLQDPHFNDVTHELCARLVVVDDDAAAKLKNAYDRGVLEHIGLSVDTLTQEGRAVTHEGKRYPVVKAFEHILSLDIVSEPAAGGKFNRLLAAKQNQEVEMTITKETVMEWVTEALAAQEQEEVPVEGEEITPEDVGDVVMEEVAAIIEEAPADADPAEVAGAIADVAEEIAVEVEEIVAEEEEEETPAAESAELEDRMSKLEARLKLADSDRVLSAALDAAKLGEMRPTVESAFKGRMYAKADLMRTIKRAKEAQAATDASGQVQGAGGGVRLLNTRGSMNPRDQAMIGLMQMMAPRIPVIGSLRHVEGITADYVQARQPEAMRAWINSGRGNYRPWDGKTSTWLQMLCGYNPLSIRAKEANDVSSITKDAINLFLAAAYDAKIEWWEPLVSTETVETIHDVTLVRDYGLSDLAIVPAGGPYVDQELSDDEETGSHIKHGNTISVTLEDLNKDRLDVLSRIPGKLATAWYNTKSTKAAAVFTVNTNAGPVLSDSGALFNNTATTSATGHANLLTAALSFASYGAARSAMRKQTDKKLGAGNRLLATPKFMLVPDELETTALQIRNSEYVPGGADNDVNPYYQKFDVVVIPDWTDANDWALLADPIQFPVLYDIKVRGYEVPQVFTAGDESSGAVFTNDTWKWKVRLMTYRFSSTYDCMCVADFRGAHKNNV